MEENQQLQSQLQADCKAYEEAVASSAKTRKRKEDLQKQLILLEQQVVKQERDCQMLKSKVLASTQSLDQASANRQGLPLAIAAFIFSQE